MAKDNLPYPLLFSPFTLGPFQMKNRLVALPVHTGFAREDGRVSPWLEEHYKTLARSGVALVVVANAAVSADGVVSRFNLRADSDEFIPGLARLAAGIKAQGALACLQLNHAGRFARTARPLLPSSITSTHLTFNLESLKGFMEFFPFEKRFGLTRHLFNQVKTWSSPMSHESRDRVVRNFASAASRACIAGFDMVELHGANGYLLCQYLSGFTNRIPSGFGGDFHSRARFPLAVIRAVRETLPPRFPMGFRLILREWVPGGIDLDQALAFAVRLETEGVSYISVSAGTYNSLFSPPVVERMARTAYLEADTAVLTRKTAIPTIISGRITLPAQGEAVLSRGAADLIGLGRPLRADPQWVAKAMDPGQKIITCINCNRCLKQVVLEKGLTCTRWPSGVRMKTRLEHQLLTRNTRALWVIEDPVDIPVFKAALPLLVRQEKDRSLPTLLFLSPPGAGGRGRAGAFLKWVRSTLDPAGLAGVPQNLYVEEPRENWEKVILREIGQGAHGRIFMGGGPGRPWRERVIYKTRGKMMACLGENPRRHRVLVLADFSDTTLLALRFLARTLMKYPRFSFTFVHVRTDPAGREARRWEEFKAIAGLDLSFPLRIVSQDGGLVSTLVSLIEKEGFGTIVMGKRGLSGIKRWLLGSVSSGVMKGLGDQSFFLID